MQMKINLTFMQGKIKTWIKIAVPTLISGQSLLSSFPPFKIHISWDQSIISMFSLGMSIGKKDHTLMKAWARVFNAI